MTTEEVLERCKQIGAAKAQDYTSGGIVPAGRHENFERAAQLVSWFHADIDRVYVTLIAVKLARLAVLLSKQDPPKNESIEDSFIDLTNYTALWAAKRTS